MKEFQLINEIIKKGEIYDTYKIKNTIYYKIVYNDEIYTISEKNNFYKIEK